VVVSGSPTTFVKQPTTLATSCPPRALHRVGAGLVERLTGRDVGLDGRVAVVAHPHPARHRRGLLPGGGARGVQLDEGQTGDHLVLATAQLAEHAGGVGRITGLAEEPAVQDHLGVGAQDHRRRPVEPGRHRAGLGQRHRGDGLGRRERGMLLGNVAGEDLERDAEPLQQLPAPW
jgi:hypothetical protein